MTVKRGQKQEKDAQTSGFEQKGPKEGLIDPSKLTRPLGGGDEPKPQAALEAMTLNELLELHGRIEALLPPTSLVDLDLERELLLQLARTKQLFDDVVKSVDTPANQKAQVVNSCTTILNELIKMQAKLYGAERTKALEGAVIRTLRAFPEDVQKRFFELYERTLETLGLPAPAMAPALAAEAL